MGQKQNQSSLITDCRHERTTIGSRQRLSGPTPSCHVRGILDHDLRSIVDSWKECNSHFVDHTIYCDPDWLGERFKNEKENVRIFFLEKGNEIVGAVPFVLAQEHLACQVGEVTLAKFPMRVLRLQGYTPNMPAEGSTYDMLIDQVLRSEFDAIVMSHVKTESFLWNYLRTSPLIREWFWCYSRTAPLPHLLIRLDGTFEGYMQKFSAKIRWTRLREIKQLRERGEVQLIRVTEASEIDTFLEAAYGIDRTTWQFRRFGRGLAARDLDVARGELQLLAKRGWLRAYLLKCGGVPCSFILGQQYGPSFHAYNVGVDEKWRSYGVGKVILLLVLEDLFKENSPQFYDFGSHANWQKSFANESYPEASIWLFRRRAYPLLTGNIYRACNVMSMRAGAALERLGLKSRVKQLLWR
jgi:ribosomal protein S18 acetylase RimI-like enzyme